MEVAAQNHPAPAPSSTALEGVPDSKPPESASAGSALDRAFFARKTLLYHNIINQLDVEASVLLGLATSLTHGTDLAGTPVPQLSTLTAADRDALPPHNVPTLKEQWHTVKLLCQTLASLVPDFGLELNPQLFAVGTLVAQCAADPDARRPQLCFGLPYALLRLVAISKRTVANAITALARNKGVSEHDVRTAVGEVGGSSVAVHLFLKQRAAAEPGSLAAVADFLSETDVLCEMLAQRTLRDGAAPAAPTDPAQPSGATTTAAPAPPQTAAPGFRVRSVSDGTTDADVTLGFSGPLRLLRDRKAVIKEESQTDLKWLRKHSVDSSGVVDMADASRDDALSGLSRKKTLIRRGPSGGGANAGGGSDSGVGASGSTAIHVPPLESGSDIASVELKSRLASVANSLDCEGSGLLANRPRPPPIAAAAAAAGEKAETGGAVGTGEESGAGTGTGGSQKKRVLLLPINGMFPLCDIDLTDVTRFGRSNTRRHVYFKTFESFVVSRNHFEIWTEQGKVLIRDVGSNGGTFLNGKRLSETGQISEAFELRNGDQIQMGRDYVTEAEPGHTIHVGKDDCLSPRKVTGPVRWKPSALHWKRVLAPEESVVISSRKHRSVKIQIVIGTWEDSILASSEDLAREQGQKTEKKDAPAVTGPVPASANKNRRSVHSTSYQSNLLLINTSAVPPDVPGLSSAAFDSLLSAPAESSDYQKQLEEQQRQVEQMLDAQQRKLQRELLHLTSCLSASEMYGDGAAGSGGGGVATMMRVGGGGGGVTRPVSMMAAGPVGAKTSSVHVEAAAAALVAKRKVKLNVVTCYGGSRIKKASLQAVGCDSDLFNIDLKNWESKRSILITDLRPRFFSSAEIEIAAASPSPSSGSTKEFTVNGRSPMTQAVSFLGTLVFVSDMKLEVTPASAATSPDASRPSAAQHRPSADATSTTPQLRYTLTGDLKEAKFIVVQRFANSREQRLIGESMGRRLARRSNVSREARYTCEVEVEEDDEASKGAMFVECPQLLMAAIMFAHVHAPA
ncbi:hypothetical protein HDU96_009586 [Phlyctochytrium bullatum]|nr:hypothetical protein HDU96_009586 [Phlyctochytrium bullatum]